MAPANHRRGDSFGGQCRYEPSPNSLTMYPESSTQKVEFLISKPLIYEEKPSIKLWSYLPLRPQQLV